MKYGVPNLQLDDFVHDLDSFGSKLYSKGGLVLLFEAVVNEHAQERRLADTYLL